MDGTDFSLAPLSLSFRSYFAFLFYCAHELALSREVSQGGRREHRRSSKAAGNECNVRKDAFGSYGAFEAYI